MMIEFQQALNNMSKGADFVSKHKDDIDTLQKLIDLTPTLEQTHTYIKAMNEIVAFCENHMSEDEWAICDYLDTLEELLHYAMRVNL